MLLNLPALLRDLRPPKPRAKLAEHGKSCPRNNQTPREFSPMQSDPMKLMQACSGDNCEWVPHEVCEAVVDSLKHGPGLNSHANERDARALILAPRMAREGWRFCPCFPLGRTQQHRQIFELVHTDLANKLAHKEARGMAQPQL